MVFRKVKIDYKKLRDWSRLYLTVNLGASDLTKYEKISKIGSGSFGVVYEIIDKQKRTEYAAKTSIFEMDECYEDTVINLTREIDIISTLDHPSILKFIGFSPNNFKNKPKPVIITEYAPNGSLEKILEMERLGLWNHQWDDTKKLINIYGITTGMSYLFNRDIIHRDLKPANILLDEYLYPKIADFGLSKNTNQESSLDLEDKKRKKSAGSGFKGTYIYSAPEIVKDNEYNEYGDVYSYAMIVYEIITNETPFAGLNPYQLFKSILKGERPQFKIPIPYCYKNLIRKCWSEDKYSRPSFHKICNILENDPNFITKNVDNDEYLSYIEYINEIQRYNNQKNQQTNTVKNKLNKFSTSLINDENLEKINNNQSNNCFINLDKFIRKDVIIKRNIFKLYQICEKETQNLFAAQMSMIKINRVSDEKIEKLSFDLKIISHLNHPSLLKFIGFSLNDFKNDRKSVIITELPSNRTIEEILELEKMNKKIYGWDDTKKLINIYGIASGMAYMHSKEIIHRCLKTSNIFLDDILFPKIGDFGLSTRFYNIDNMSHQSMSGQKGTPIYSAPEVLQSNEYSKSSDVYSFAFIVYEILMNEKPYNELSSINQIFQKAVINRERPEIKETIPQVYKELIEQCWSHDPNDRPKFEDIVYILKMDQRFITDKINKEDYQKYISFIDSHTNDESKQKVDEYLEKINENSQDINESEHREDESSNKQFDNSSNLIEEDVGDVDISIIKTSKNDKEKMTLIDNYISTNNAVDLMNYLNNNCSN